VGVYPERVPLSILDVIVGEKRLVGSVQHHYDEDLPVALQLLADGTIQVRPLVTDQIALEQVVDQGLRALAEQPDQHLKIIVNPTS
jgi:(R,R)-butanediol dehydrogenase / meso-butanediol dehydrogenase / diacetyl reductase